MCRRKTRWSVFVAPSRNTLLATGSVVVALALAGCANTSILSRSAAPSAPPPAPLLKSTATNTPSQLGVPYVVTKNTTRIAGANPVSDAAAVALAVYPSVTAGTHPGTVVLAPTDDWQAALAASSLMGAPFAAPELQSTSGELPAATASALSLLAPTGESATHNAQVIRVGDVPTPAGYKTTAITASDPYSTAAAIDAYETKLRGRPSVDVVIASGQASAWAMPAAGWAAESGEPILYVTSNSVPAATAADLADHPHAHIYVLGPTSVISNGVLTSLKTYGTVKRISASSPAALSVTFAEYRDPACPSNPQECAHIPGSFGWAVRTPGHGYVLINDSQPLMAAAAAALSASGDFGPQLLVEQANTLPQAVLNFFVNYATPGYSSEGPTAAVYNHGWIIGDTSQISEVVQAQVDSLLEVVPAK